MDNQDGPETWDPVVQNTESPSQIPLQKNTHSVGKKGFNEASSPLESGKSEINYSQNPGYNDLSFETIDSQDELNSRFDKFKKSRSTSISLKSTPVAGCF